MLLNKPLIFAGMFGLIAYFFKDTIMSATVDTQDALNNPNVRAFLAMIRKFESNGDYAILYGGGHFNDFSKHPNVRVPFFNPKTKKNDFSTAAGAYQINMPTYKTLMLLPNMPKDFSPRSQDILAVALLKTRGSLVHIISGNFNQAVRIAAKTWASLPYSPDMQNPKSIAQATTAYLGSGGVIA